MEKKNFSKTTYEEAYDNGVGEKVFVNRIQDSLVVKFKKLDSKAVTPSYAHLGEDAGLDLTPIDVEYNPALGWIYHTGIAMEIPKGYVGLLFVRSSSRKTNSYLTNHVGVIDSGYRGEITGTIKNIDLVDKTLPYQINGDPVFQIIILPYPIVTLIETDKLSESSRGTSGHGDSDKLKR